MAFQKVHLHDVAGQGQQALEIAQAPGAVRGGFGGFFQCGGGMFLGELQEALHDAQALWAASLMHGGLWAQVPVSGPIIRQRSSR